MKRDTLSIKEEKNKILATLSAIDGVENIVPAPQKRTFNFKGRKSSDIASKIMQSITPPNGVICDPFVGSNSFGIAAVSSGFQFVGSELDNYTFDVDKVLFTKCNFEKLEQFYIEIKDACMSSIMGLYETQCCGTKNFISKLHFDPEGSTNADMPEYFQPIIHRDIINNQTIVLSSACPICKQKRKIFEKVDLEKINETNALDTSEFPHHKLIENSRINITATHGADYYDRNFTNRAKYALLLLQKNIKQLEACIERDILEHCLVASLTLSRICQYGSGSEYIYQVMRNQAQEKNVWEIFESKYTSFVRFKKYYDRIQVKDISNSSSPMYIYNGDYSVMLEGRQSTIDVIYTDPPYTDQVPYLERSQLFRDWLVTYYDKFKYALTPKMLDDEIVISNAPSRYETKSGDLQYFNDIDKMFCNFYNVLKPDGRVVLTIKLGNSKYLSTLAYYITLARKNGFEYIANYSIDKNDPTLRKQAATKNTVANEMLVFFTKLDPDCRYWFYGDIDLEASIRKHLYDKLKNSEKGFLSLTECVTKVQSFLEKTYSIKASESVQEKIVKVINENFNVAKTSFVYIDSNKLYIEEENPKDLFAVLYDIIPIIIKSFPEDGFTMDDLYFEIINKMFDGNGKLLSQFISTPQYENEIQLLLNNYCTMNDKNKYILKKPSNELSEDCVDVSTMDGYEFEDLIKKLLLEKGYYDVIRIGGAGDRGIDIMAKRKIDGIEEGYIIQCKRWIGNVGGTPIQRLHSMMVQMSPVISHAICVTTSNYTNDAIREASNTGVELINGSQLMTELSTIFPNQYYHGALQII